MADEQELQVEQSPDGDSTEAVRPEWLPSNFKSPEELAKSYGELQGKLTQTSQQLKEQQEQFEAYLAMQEEQAVQQQGEQMLPQYQDQLREAYENDPLAVVAWMAEQAAQRASANGRTDETQYALVADAAERQLMATYDDWQEYAPRVAERLKERGDIYPEELFTTPQSTAQVLEEVYKTLKFDDIASGKITPETEDMRLAKQQAQTISGQGGRPEAPSDDEEFFARLQAAHEQTWSAHRGNA